jgi:hypothetical protein
MMSIAAISLPELLILKKVMHWRALALFTGIVAEKSGTPTITAIGTAKRLSLFRVSAHCNGKKPRNNAPIPTPRKTHFQISAIIFFLFWWNIDGKNGRGKIYFKL